VLTPTAFAPLFYLILHFSLFLPEGKNKEKCKIR
jgi:hypothetical protein